MNKQPTIIIDTREQRPLEFRGMKTLRRKLEVGDYSVRGLTKSVAVERKSKEDLFSTMTGKNRERFKKELERAAALNMMTYLVVEYPLERILAHGSQYCKINPHRMLESLLTFGVTFAFRVMFVGDRQTASVLIKSILTAHWREAGA